MVKFGDKEIMKERLYTAKRPTKICYVNDDNEVTPKLVKTKTNFKCLIVSLDKTIRSLVLIMPKMIDYVKTFKVKEGNNNLMSFRINDENLGLRLKIQKTLN